MNYKYEMLNRKYATIVALFAIGFIVHSASADTAIPSWIKSSAKYWRDGQLGDDEYVKGIQYLIQNGVMHISTSEKIVEKSKKIPSWVKINAGLWADGSIVDAEYVNSIQYLIGAGIINLSQQSTPVKSSESSLNSTSGVTVVTDMAKCNSAPNPAAKQTCMEEIQSARDLKEKIASATPYVAGPVTYYLIKTDLINTGDGGVFINIHTVLENTGNPSSNPDLFCTGPLACNYHLSDGNGDYPPAIYSLTSGHLELRYQKPVAIDWNFYSKANVGGFTYDSSKSYSLKINEPFGSKTIPLKLITQ